MKAIIFISGPMTGIANYNRAAFLDAEELAIKEGYYVLNPARLPGDLPDRVYLPICITMLEQADAILMLDGHETSKGATAELAYARRQGKDIMIIKNGEIEFSEMTAKEGDQ